MATAGIKCGACKQLMLDDDGQPRTSCAHQCKNKTCKAWLHSGILCSSVWQPYKDGNNYFCGRACIEAHNARMQEEHTEELARNIM